MRVAILSLILNTNYGGILQSFALQTILERLGHDVKVIDRQAIPDISFRRYITEMPKRFVQKYILKQNINFWPTQHYEHLRYVERSAETREFIFRHVHIRKCNVLRRLRNFEFDAILVGSDQVWRPAYFVCWGNIRDAFLDFAKTWNVRRISYAASFGTDEWEYDDQQTTEAKELIKKFNAISVREDGGVTLCREHLNANAVQVLDPTLLLNREDYEKLIEERKTPPVQGSLLNYILDDNEEKSALIAQIAKDKSLTPFRINETESISSDLHRQPVETWLKSFRDAEFIVTDSFHACVFSIIFHKPFICLGNKARGLSRFQIFSKNLGLMNNIISSPSEYNSSLDYIPSESVYQKLEEMKAKSIDFLRTNLR